MKDQSVYIDDTFGLKTMNERGDLIFNVVDGVTHNQWFNTKEIYEKYVFPYLE